MADAIEKAVMETGDVPIPTVATRILPGGINVTVVMRINQRELEVAAIVTDVGEETIGIDVEEEVSVGTEEEAAAEDSVEAEDEDLGADAVEGECSLMILWRSSLSDIRLKL